MRPETTFTLTNDAGRDIWCTLTLPEHPHTAPVTILMHGFKGFRNWGFFPIAAQDLAEAGSIVLRIDASLNGMRGTNDRVVSVEDFANNTVTRDVDDLLHVIRSVPNVLAEHIPHVEPRVEPHVEPRVEPPVKPPVELNLVSHSRGSATAQIAAADLHRAGTPISGRIVVWNGIGMFRRFTDRQRQVWLDAGYVEIENARTGQMLRMNSEFVLDLERNAERFDLVEAARINDAKLCYIHAEQDVTVPLKEVMHLRGRAGAKAPLEVIPATGHTFGITHPVEHITKAFVDVMTRTKKWLALGALLFTVMGCEAFVIGSSKPAVIIERSQRSAVGVVHLFKAELDTGNITAATELMRNEDGKPFLALEKYEMQEEVARWMNRLDGKTITGTSTDTVNASSMVVHATLNHIMVIDVATLRIDSVWYITRLMRRDQ
jgi:hypothetical protein